jgi:hypothetical protein
MIIVRTAARREVKGWRVTTNHPAVKNAPPVLLQPDGTMCGATSFLHQGMRAAATTAAERTALERGGYLQRRRRARVRSC